MIESTINSLPCMPIVKFTTEPLNICQTVLNLFNLEYVKSTEKINSQLKENSAES